jgi:fructose transport system substrate-binding protein
MARNLKASPTIGRRFVLLLTALTAVVVTACSSGTGSSPAASGAATSAPVVSGAGTGSGGPIGVTLITKTATNPFFVAMAAGAKESADKLGITLTVAAGAEDGDTATQITAIENAISRGDKGILITPSGPDVNPAIKKARDAGLTVIALDTPPDPPIRSTSPSRPTTSRPAS